MKSKTSKLISLSIVAVAFVIGLGSCNDNRVANVNSKYKINPNKYAKIYMPQARQRPHKVELFIVDSTQSIIYGAAYAGPETAPRDIHVKFSVNPALVDSFNNNNLTSYSILPANAYKLSKTSAVIPKGERATPAFKVKINPFDHFKVGQEFLLPITMKEESGDVNINKEQKTAYFLISGEIRIRLLGKSGWTLIQVPPNCCGDSYTPDKIIDGVDNGVGHFWLVATEKPSAPWSFTVDMGKSQTINGFKLVGNSDASGDNPNYYKRNPKKVTFEFSDDGQTFSNSESFTLPFTGTNISDVVTKVFLSKPVKARYFKFTINTNVDGDNTIANFGELYAFQTY
jgi:hypothetical protein